MEAKDICGEVYDLSGFYRSAAFAASNDPDDRLIFSLLRRVARDIAKYRWNELVISGTLEILAGTKAYDLPADFREFVPNSFRTLDDLRAIDFPTSFETWAQIDSLVGPTGLSHRLRLQEGKMATLEADENVYTIRFEYLSNFPVIDGDTVQQLEPTRIKTFEKDSDVWILDEDLIIKGLKAKWSLEKSLSTLQADIGDYNNYQHELKGTQAGSQRIALGGKRPYWPSPPYTNTWKGT